MKTSINYRDVFNMWEAIQGTVQAHVEDCHRLIKDTAVQRGRLTRSLIYTLSSQRAVKGAPMGRFYLKPKGTHTEEANVNAPPHSVTGEETQALQLSWYGNTCQPSYVWHKEAQLPLIDWTLFFLALSYAFIKKAIQRQKQWAL